MPEAVTIPESVAVKLSGKNCVVPEVVTVPASSKSSQKKEMNNFLNEAHKKSVSDGIRRCNKEKKLKKSRAESLKQRYQNSLEQY
ncbi:hypothetical protein GLOIN_2v1765104 [Rhizophagus irregularis DAOM 181602=DAOM 197198]|nr:hypothetical protein GLOIN_2v1765104 [Rhizophagus irregularis DAOM 181602=DAOM 197198]